MVEGTVDIVVFPRLDLNGCYGHVFVVVYQVVHFAVLLVVVVEKVESVCTEFLGHHGFVYRAEVGAAFIAHDGHDIVAVEHASQYAHIIQIELQEVLAAVFNQRERRLADGFDLQRYAR